MTEATHLDSPGGPERGTTPSRTLRGHVHRVLESHDPSDPLGVAVDLTIVGLIVINLVALVLETVEPIHAAGGRLFRIIEWISVAVFTVEYLLRLWACTADPRYAHPVTGRLRFAVSFFALIDFVAIAPFYLAFFAVDLRFTRVLRLLRFIWLAKLGRHSQAVRALSRVFFDKRHELGAAALIAAILLLVGSSFMYFAEHEAQPEKFSSIPATMWWSVVTMTTVGYGDAYPITPVGKIIGAFIAVSGILMFALPTAILGSGFYAELHGRKPPDPGARECPHCGKTLDG